MPVSKFSALCRDDAYSFVHGHGRGMDELMTNAQGCQTAEAYRLHNVITIIIMIIIIITIIEPWRRVSAAM